MADHSPPSYWLLVPAHTTTVSYLAKLDGGCSEAQLSSTPKKPPVPPPGSTKARPKNPGTLWYSSSTL